MLLGAMRMERSSVLFLLMPPLAVVWITPSRAGQAASVAAIFMVVYSTDL
jgi:hypothetical protein